MNLQLGRQTKLNTNISHRNPHAFKAICLLRIRARGVSVAKCSLPVFIQIPAGFTHFSLPGLKPQLRGYQVRWHEGCYTRKSHGRWVFFSSPRLTASTLRPFPCCPLLAGSAAAHLTSWQGQLINRGSRNIDQQEPARHEYSGGPKGKFI